MSRSSSGPFAVEASVGLSELCALLRFGAICTDEEIAEEHRKDQREQEPRGIGFSNTAGTSTSRTTDQNKLELNLPRYTHASGPLGIRFEGFQASDAFG